MSGSGRYNAEFRTDVVIRVLEEGRSIISVSKDLRISDHTLRNWINNRKRKHDPERSENVVNKIYYLLHFFIF